MNIKQLAATALVIVSAVLVLYFGVRFIDTLFNKVEKDITTTTSQTTNRTGFSCRELLPHGEFVEYEDGAICHARAAAGATVIRIWRK